MQIKAGCTRVVILTQTSAIKIALPFSGPFITLKIVLKALLKGELLAKLKKHSGNLTQLAVRVSTIGGIDSNRREIRISREHPEYPIAPVLRSYLWGIVIVMQRGEPVEELPELWNSQFSLPARFQHTDLFLPNNLGRIGGKLRFIDYGDSSADEILPLFFDGRNCDIAM